MTKLTLWKFEIYNNVICIFNTLFSAYWLKEISNRRERGDGSFTSPPKSEKNNTTPYDNTLLHFHQIFSPSFKVCVKFCCNDWGSIMDFAFSIYPHFILKKVMVLSLGDLSIWHDPLSSYPVNLTTVYFCFWNFKMFTMKIPIRLR